MRPSKTNASLRRFPVLLAALLALGACGGDPDAADADIASDAADVESIDDIETDVDAIGEDDTGDVSNGDAAPLPEWFPEDVYLPEAYTVVGAMDVGTVQRLELRVEGTVAEVAEQARAHMQANGWGDGAGDGETMGYTIGDRSAMLTINERDDGAVRVGYPFTTL